MKEQLLLAVDAVANLLLGGALVAFPRPLFEWAGLPTPEPAIYASVLGAVLFGIGIALLVQCFGDGSRRGGLGMIGAIAINICGAGVLAVWLVFGGLSLPARGAVMLWIVAVVVLGIAAAEVIASFRRRPTTE